MSILDWFRAPPSRQEAKQMQEELAAPTLAGVRPVISGHPADGLTPERLAAIHRAAAQGDALRYLELAEDIEERDLHYAGVISTRKRSVTQLPIRVEAASDDPEHVKHADFLREWLGRDVLQAALFDMLDGVGKGFSVIETMWSGEDGKQLPAAFVYRPQRWFEAAREDGNTIMLREGATLQPLNPWKFVVHRHPSKSGLVMRSGLARVASWAWMFKSFTSRDWAIFVQNYGQPMRVGRFGPESTADDRDVLWRAVANIAGDCAAIIPKGMEIEFVEVGDLKAGAELYERRSDWLDRQISKLVLGQTTTTDAVSGGHAVAQEHRLVQEDIERSDATMLSTTVTQQVGVPIITLNYGPQRLYPRILIGRPDEVPLAIVVDAVAKLAPIGLRVEASQLRDRLGLSEPAPDAEIVGGKPAPAEPPKPPATPVAPQSMLSLISRHVTQPDADVADALTERLALDAQGALHGLTAAIRREFDQATDMRDLQARLERMQLDPEQFARAIGAAMAVAHLAGQAAVLDELRGG